MPPSALQGVRGRAAAGLPNVATTNSLTKLRARADAGGARAGIPAADTRHSEVGGGNGGQPGWRRQAEMATPLTRVLSAADGATAESAVGRGASKARVYPAQKKDDQMQTNRVTTIGFSLPLSRRRAVNPYWSCLSLRFEMKLWLWTLNAERHPYSEGLRGLDQQRSSPLPVRSVADHSGRSRTLSASWIDLGASRLPDQRATQRAARHAFEMLPPSRLRARARSASKRSRPPVAPMEEIRAADPASGVTSSVTRKPAKRGTPGQIPHSPRARRDEPACTELPV